VPDFVHGSKSRYLLNGNDVSRYLTSASMSGGRDTTETTTFGQGAQTFVAGLRNGGEGSLDFRVEQASQDRVMRRILRRSEGRDDNLFSYLWGNDVGAQAIGVRCILTSREFSAEPGDTVNGTLGVQGNRGVDDLLVLQPILRVTATGNAASVDDEDVTVDGAIGHLHVLDVTAGTLDVKIQHSSNGTTWVDLITFAQVAAGSKNKFERVVTPDMTVNNQVRAQWTLGVGGTSATFAVLFGRGLPNEDVS
jgi:hypothetical protein